jgi:hypothetical protein
MRSRELTAVLTFFTATDAIAMERYCQAHGVPGRLIPTPTSITADCGMCWRTSVDRERQALSAAETAGIPIAGSYQLLL